MVRRRVQSSWSVAGVIVSTRTGGGLIRLCVRWCSWYSASTHGRLMRLVRSDGSTVARGRAAGSSLLCALSCVCACVCGFSCVCACVCACVSALAVPEEEEEVTVWCAFGDSGRACSLCALLLLLLLLSCATGSVLSAIRGGCTMTRLEEIIVSVCRGAELCWQTGLSSEAEVA